MLDTITLKETTNHYKCGRIVLFVGANTMNEIGDYNFDKYDNGLFFEAISTGVAIFNVPAHGLFDTECI